MNNENEYNFFDTSLKNLNKTQNNISPILKKSFLTLGFKAVAVSLIFSSSYLIINYTIDNVEKINDT